MSCEKSDADELNTNVDNRQIPFCNPIAKREIQLEGKNRAYLEPPRTRAEHGVGRISRLPVSLRIVLESLLRHCDGKRVTESQVRALANWQPERQARRRDPVHGRARRAQLRGGHSAARRPHRDPRRGAAHGLPGLDRRARGAARHGARPHATVDYHGTPDALGKNMALEIERNDERFRFVKWAMQAYKGIRLMPPGWGILHQLNLEFLAPGYLEKDGVCYPDSLVGTDSHTCMIAGLGCVGWGVGGIEAQAAVLGQPVYFLTPDVVGVHVTGALKHGVTSTDLVLHVTEMLRKAKVVGQVRRVLRRRRGEPDAARPRDDLQHGRRIRRDDRLFPGRRADLPLSRADRPPGGARARGRRRITARRAASARRAKAKSTTAA